METSGKCCGSSLHQSDPADYSCGTMCNHDGRSETIAIRCTSGRYHCHRRWYHRNTRRTVLHRPGTGGHWTGRARNEAVSPETGDVPPHIDRVADRIVAQRPTLVGAGFPTPSERSQADEGRRQMTIVVKQRKAGRAMRRPPYIRKETPPPAAATTSAASTPEPAPPLPAPARTATRMRGCAPGTRDDTRAATPHSPRAARPALALTSHALLAARGVRR